jgi:hypothetical protein
MSALRRASAFTLDRFTTGSRTLFRRYVRLGAALCGLYAVSAGAYLVVVFGMRQDDDGAWTLVAAIASLALVAWITALNFVYLLIQIVVAADDCGVRAAAARVARLLRGEGQMLMMVFGAILALVAMTTGASILATAALGLIAFVPLVSLAALPLQLLAWLLRGLVFQYIGLSGLTAYARVHRGFAGRLALDAGAGTPVHRIGRTA